MNKEEKWDIFELFHDRILKRLFELTESEEKIEVLLKFPENVKLNDDKIETLDINQIIMFNTMIQNLRIRKYKQDFVDQDLNNDKKD